MGHVNSLAGPFSPATQQTTERVTRTGQDHDCCVGDLAGSATRWGRTGSLSKQGPTREGKAAHKKAIFGKASVLMWQVIVGNLHREKLPEDRGINQASEARASEAAWMC